MLETVESVLRGDEAPTELIIIDQSDVQHPNLPSLQPSRACRIRYLWAHSVGLSRARNAGAAAAEHEILAFIDDDMRVTFTWFGSLIRALINAGKRAVVSGRVLSSAPEVPKGFVLALVVDEKPAVFKGRIRKDVLPGNHMAMYQSALAEVGGFDERLGTGSSFPAAEDNDLGYRFLEAGYQIVHEPRAVLYHRAWRSRREYLPIRWSYGYGKGGFYTKHMSFKDRYMLQRMGWDITHRLLLFPRRMLREPLRACGDVVYIFGILFGTIQWLRVRRKAHAAGDVPSHAAFRT